MKGRHVGQTGLKVLLTLVVIVGVVILVTKVSRTPGAPTVTRSSEAPEDVARRTEADSTTTTPAAGSEEPAPEPVEASERSDVLRSLGIVARAGGGEGIAGVHVSLTPLDVVPNRRHPWSEDEWTRVEVATVHARTDAEGVTALTFDAEAQPLGPVVLWASHPDFGCRYEIAESWTAFGTEVAFELDEQPACRVEVSGLSAFDSEDALLSVHGYTTEIDDAVLGDRELRARRAFRREYTLEVASGSVPVPHWDGRRSIVARQGRLKSAPFRGAWQETLELNLHPAFTLQGRVLNAEGALDAVVEVSLDEEIQLAILPVLDDGFGPTQVPVPRAGEIVARLLGGNLVAPDERFPVPEPGTTIEVVFEARPGDSLDFFVTDEAGNPIAGAYGFAAWEGDPGRTPYAATNEEGRGTFTGLVPSHLWIPMIAEGFARQTFGPVVFPAIEEPLHLQLSSSGSVRGRVVHKDEPVPSFEVVFWKDDPMEMQNKPFQSAENGEFLLEDVPTGNIEIYASSYPDFPRALTQSVEVIPGETAEVLIELPEKTVGRGMVVDGFTRDPLPEATVQVYTNYGGQFLTPWGPPQAVGGDGSFTVDGLPPGDARLIARCPGYGRLLFGQFIEVGGEADFGMLPLFRGRTLTVQLVADPPVDYSRYSVASTGGVLFLPAQSCDSEGIVTFEECIFGDYWFEITGPDVPPTDVSHHFLEEGEDWFVTLPVSSGSTLVVELDPASALGAVDQGHLTARATLFVEGAMHQRTYEIDDLDEPLRLTHLFGDEVTVEVFVGQRLLGRGIYPVEPGAERTVRLRLEGLEDRTFQIVDESGLALGGIHVEAWCQDSPEGWFVEGISDPSGVVRILSPPCQDLVAFMSHSLLGILYDAEISFAGADDVPVVEFAPKARIELRILDGSAPVTGVTVSLVHPGSNYLHDFQYPDGSGRVFWRDLSESLFKIQAGAPGYWTARTTVRAEPRPSVEDIQLRAVGDVAIDVRDASGPAAGVALRIRFVDFDEDVADWIAKGRLSWGASTTSDADGRIELQGIPNGDYEYELDLPGGGRKIGQFTVPRGAVTGLDVLLPR